MNPSDYTGLGGLLLIVALVQVAKQWVTTPRDWPLLAMVIGLVLNVAIALWAHTDLFVAGFTGLLIGLGAAGGYDLYHVRFGKEADNAAEKPGTETMDARQQARDG